MRIDILTLFPDNMNAFLHESILGRAAKKGIVGIRCVQIRDFTENRQNQVDDYPYGGGWGCVMMAQPLADCVKSVLEEPKSPRTRVIYLSPQGQTFTQDTARRLVRDYDHLVLVCGHYEGVDERFIEQCVDEEISIGDFVLTGGELAAMAVTDAVCRLVPGVLSDEACYTGESHWDGLLEYPQYTRPEVWEGREVPAVLRSGNQAEIDRWRRKQMLLRTAERRPDLMGRFTPDAADEKLLAEIERDKTRLVLSGPVDCRPAELSDLDNIMLTIRQSKNYLKKHRVDQWQSGYPDDSMVIEDIERGEGHVMTYCGNYAGYFMLTEEPQEEYAALTDGKWRAEGRYCTLHRCCVLAEYRGSGMADRLTAAAEALARARGASALRADTHRHNEPMKALLRRSGFVYRGNIRIIPEEERGHDGARQAFEKLLK